MDPKQEACKVALKKMFEGSHFDICTILNLAKLTNTIADRETMATLQAIHCCNWTDMTPEFRNWVFETVLTMFSSNGFNLNKIDFKSNNNFKLIS